MNFKIITIYFLMITVFAGFANALTVTGGKTTVTTTYSQNLNPPPDVLMTGQTIETTGASYQLSAEQIQAVGDVIQKIIIEIVALIDDTEVKGYWDKYSDDSGDFNIQMVATGDDTYQLELTPTNDTITSPSTYGNTNWTFNINSSDWSDYYRVKYTAIGTTGLEVVYIVVPEPATIALLALGSLILRKKK